MSQSTRLLFLVPLIALILNPSDADPIDKPDRSRIANQYPWETAGDFSIRQAMERPLASVKFDAASLETVIRKLGVMTGLNIVANWPALESAGIERDAEVTFSGQNLTGAGLLRLILEQVSAGETELLFEISDGVIRVSTLEDLSRNTILVTYNCEDLVNVAEKQIAEHIRSVFDAVLKYTARDISRDAVEAERLVRKVVTDSRNELRTQLIETIQGSVSPESWREAGGNVGSITIINDQLIVTQTRDNHEQILNLLEALRSRRSGKKSIGRWP